MNEPYTLNRANFEEAFQERFPGLIKNGTPYFEEEQTEDSNDEYSSAR